MPLVYKRTFETGWVALWQITERAEQLLPLVSQRDALIAGEFKSESRCREWLAWRALVAELLPGVEVSYNDVGAPQLIGCEGFIGVSHEKEYVAVVYNSLQRCAVDIEHKDRNFSRVASRYISDGELSELHCNDHPMFNAVIWCAKEVLYKSANQLGLDLLKDIKITMLDIDNGEIHGEINCGRDVKLAFFVYENRLVVYTLLK